MTHQDKELPGLRGKRAPSLLISPSGQGRLLAHQGSLTKAHLGKAAQWQVVPDSQAPNYGSSIRQWLQHFWPLLDGKEVPNNAKMKDDEHPM
jgi:hypothetical protein